MQAYDVRQRDRPAWLLVADDNVVRSMAGTVGGSWPSPSVAEAHGHLLEQVLDEELAPVVRQILAALRGGSGPTARHVTGRHGELIVIAGHRVPAGPGAPAECLLTLTATDPATGATATGPATGPTATDATVGLPLEDVLAGLPCLVWSAAVDGRNEYISPQWTGLLGLEDERPAADALRAAHNAVVHPDDVTGLLAHWESCRANGSPFRHEYRMRHPDGTYRWVESQGRLVGSGAARRWYGAVTDVTDRKRAELAAAAEHARFRGIFDAVPATLVVIDWSAPTALLGALGAGAARAALGEPAMRAQLVARLRIVEGNPWAQRRFQGRTMGELTARMQAVLGHPDNAGALTALLTAHADGLPAVTVELVVVRADGTDGREEMRLTFPAATDEPGPTALAVMTDVTERAAALAAQESLVRTVAESFPGLVGYWDTGEVCRFVNKTYTDWLGITREQAIGRSVVDLLGAAFRAENAERIEGALAGRAQRFERAMDTLDGGVRETLVHYLPHVVEGRVRGFVVAVADITALKAAQAEVVESNQRLQRERDRAEHERRGFEMLFEHSPDARLVVHPDGHLVRANAAALTMFGLDLDELAAVNVDDLVPAEYRALHPALRQGYLEHPTDRLMAERAITALRRDGGSFRVQLSLGAFSEGSNPLVILTARDESELAQAYERLEETTLAQEQFITIASHDLREPMIVVSNFSRLLLEDHAGDLDPQGRHYLNTVIGSADRMRRLLDDLLAYVRVDRTELQPSPLALDDVLREVGDDLAVLLAQRRADLLAHPLPLALGQASLLRVLLFNLIDNATKFHPPSARPAVEVRAEERGEMVEIVVSDNGIGIPGQYLGRIFEPFRRLQSNKHYPGSGIGLAVCRRIVHRHGGAIWARSSPGRGTEIHFTLPRPKPPQETGDE